MQFAIRAVKSALVLSALGAALVAQAATVINGSFEQPGSFAPGQSSYCYTSGAVDISIQCSAPVPGWTGKFQLIAADSGPWQTPNSRPNAGLIDGNVVAGLQVVSSLFQDLLLSAGTHTLSWVDANRGGEADFQAYEVLLGTVSLGTFTTQQSQGWSQRSVTFTTGAGMQTLSFYALNPNNNDQTTFLDNVAVTTAVPEPQSLALVLAGVGVAGVLMRRRVM